MKIVIPDILYCLRAGRVTPLRVTQAGLSQDNVNYTYMYKYIQERIWGLMVGNVVPSWLQNVS